MKERVDKLEEAVNGVRVDQGCMKESLAMIVKTLDRLVDVRAETLHLVKQQEDAKKNDDEIFERLRETEKSQAANDERYVACNDKIDACDKNVEDLRSNQRWGVVTIFTGIMAIIVYGIRKAFFT